MGRLGSALRDLKPYRHGHLLRDALDLRRGLRVLDVAGGTGVVEARARLQGTVVLDADADHLRRAQGKAAVQDAVRGDGRELPFADGAFDRILVVDSLHHVEDPETLLVEVVRVLADDGRLVVQEVLPGSAAGWGIRAWERMLGEPCAFLGPREMKTLLERIDLDCKIEKWSPSRYAAVAMRPGAREVDPRPGALA